MTRLRTPLLFLIAPVLALALAACGGGGTGSEAGHNDADVGFAQGMIPHHAQAVTMADQALAGATDPRIRTLAREIKAAQDPEIATMTGWLEDWGEEVPDTGGGDMDMSGEPGMDGMMSADQMSALDAASGARFDTLWLRLMVQHHLGAITAARTEVAEGQDADAIALARRIVTSQQAEVDRMERWRS